ncbi:MAG: glycoside hydrolase N-terminal domain-containing protein [Verrucomicrobia bacterium]|nr:glycoside hydrolase N-terminal domain-containing protein [Verrucomicrobiota bacterium]
MRPFVTLFGAILAASSAAIAFAAPETILRYASPAQKWVEALPVGNGRLGAMVFGGWQNERLALNEARRHHCPEQDA